MDDFFIKLVVKCKTYFFCSFPLYFVLKIIYIYIIRVDYYNMEEHRIGPPLIPT